MTSSRNSTFDIIRAIGIVLMVSGHSAMPHSSVIFRFHMALFFIVSGWLFSDKYIESMKNAISFCVKRIKTLYVPFVLFNLITVLLNNVFIRLNIYTDNPLFLEPSELGGAAAYGLASYIESANLAPYIKNVFMFSGESQLGGATWFLRVMFGVSILWCLTNYLIKSVFKASDLIRFVINEILAVVLMLLSYKWMGESKNFILQFQTVASSYVMFCTGYYIRNVIKELNRVREVLLMVISFAVLLVCDYICIQKGWDSNVNSFHNPIMFLVSSYAGFLAVYYASCIISRFKCFLPLTIIGRHTLSIVVFHFLSFKIVNLLQCFYYKQPYYRIASFPTFYPQNGWWVVYGIVGVLIPVVLGVGWSRGKQVLTSLVMKHK